MGVPYADFDLEQGISHRVRLATGKDHPPPRIRRRRSDSRGSEKENRRRNSENRKEIRKSRRARSHSKRRSRLKLALIPRKILRKGARYLDAQLEAESVAPLEKLDDHPLRRKKTGEPPPERKAPRSKYHPCGPPEGRRM